ncbi:hypothetical protein POV27_10880 [Aureisphaera galaxeae]|uniref:hypothetical protein n=1 Tax=Aureisphaera galaxeae TaxID=1538023 RepID=UPI002350AF91|nr:hypothetical protein [Aureisphaera galaxeae]MDC8004553.1 hypothetical protein [Aureisphaera galaxeae]
MLTTFRFLLLVLLITTLSCSDETPIETPQMWGSLQPGPYYVGYTTHFLYDRSRPAIPYSDWNGQLFPNDETEGRQMQVNVWYPTNSGIAKDQMIYGDYIDLNSRKLDFSPLSESQIVFSDGQIVEKINALGGNGNFTIEDLSQLRTLKSFAIKDAEPTSGKFPLVVFPNGMSPMAHSIMCEYIASQGYVVASTTLKGAHASAEDISSQGLETAVMDLDFAISFLANLPQVDSHKIGLIGNAINSSQITAYQNRNANVDCLISLDGGLISNFEQRLLKGTPFYSTNAVDIPILAIYVPHPAIDPSYIFHLKHSDRYFFRFKTMSEFHFLNYGQLESFKPHIIGEPKGNVQEGHSISSIYMVQFLNAFLKGSSEGLDFIEGPVSSEYTTQIDTSFIKRSVPKPPNIATIKNAFRMHGFQYVDSIYTSYKKANPSPFQIGFYKEMKDWLAWRKDPTYKYRYALFKLAYDSYPNSAEVHYYLGYYALELKKYDESKKHFDKAITLLEADKNPELTVERKLALLQSIDGFLNELP